MELDKKEQNVKNLTTLKRVFRTNYLTTLLLGRQFKTSLNLLEIDITYRCNLRCKNCDRSCCQAPSSKDDMEIYQIEKFISDSIEKEYLWKKISILGGEPTLHPNVLDIMKILSEYTERYKKTEIVFVSNGFAEKTRDILHKIPNNVTIRNTNKISPAQEKFEPFNLAPIDFKWNFLTDYRNACWITEYCGMGLTPKGYYLCAVAGGIDRIFRFNVGLKNIPENEAVFSKQKSLLCRYCGHFNRGVFVSKDQRSNLKNELISISWRKAYESHKQNDI